MTKKAETVRVWHPTYKAEAHPLRKDLDEWIKQGWQPVTDTKE